VPATVGVGIIIFDLWRRPYHAFGEQRHRPKQMCRFNLAVHRQAAAHATSAVTAATPGEFEKRVFAA